MKLLSYFARYFVGIVFLMQAGLVIIVVTTTFVENANFLSNAEHGASVALRLAFFSAIQFSYIIFPVACFLAAMVAGTLLARSGEILAMEAAGITIWRAIAAFTVVIVIVMGVSGFVGERLVPYAKISLDYLRRGENFSETQGLGRYYDRHTQWYRNGDLLLYLPSFNPNSYSLTDVVAYRMQDGLVVEITDAEQLIYDSNKWWLINARQHRIKDAVVTLHQRLQLPLAVTLSDLLEVMGDPSVMSSKEIANFADRRSRAGFDTAPFLIEWHNRIAYPLSTLAMFILAIPWALNPNRRRSLAANLGFGVVAIALLLSVTYIFRLLALSHRLSPAMGAWGINIFCLVLTPVSALLYRRYRVHGGLR
ncbi:MAG: LptF/LptG family permease [Deltaproteobacteria bacterium]|nr:LptF/LptG family permease [Deltaproteobacteria bacterium]